MKENLGNVVGYVRVSTDEQADEGYSLEFQKQAIINYVNVNLISTFELITDDGYSAQNLNRPGIKKIFDLIKCGKCNALLFPKLDRLSRQITDYNKIVKVCSEHEVALISLQDGKIVHNASTRLVNNILMSVAQAESEINSERTKAGLLQKARNGEYPLGGKMPLGISKDENHKIYHNEDIIIVKDIFKIIKKELYSQDVINEFNNLYPNIKMDIVKMKRIINNSIYRGFVIVQNEKFYLIDPIISESQYLIIKNKKMLKHRMYDMHYYQFKNKVFINEQKAYHSKNKGRSKYYKYYYIKGIYVAEDVVLTEFYRYMLFKNKQSNTRLNRSLKLLADEYLSGNLKIEDYNYKSKLLLNKYQNLEFEYSVSQIKSVKITIEASKRNIYFHSKVNKKK